MFRLTMFLIVKKNLTFLTFKYLKIMEFFDEMQLENLPHKSG